MNLAVAGLPNPHIDIRDTIGRGGFAVVHRALDTKLNRQVAVKVLTGAVDQAQLQHFEQECQIHGPLSNHPSIVTVYDAGLTTDGRPYLVMEYLEGGTVSDQIERCGPIPWADAVSLLLPICDAVSAAHQRGILHRDIKPSNILLGPDGPKLADFGIACGSDATSPLFAVSWLHAAPEANDNTRDERSDVYSLGSTLYEMVSGTAPFAAAGQSMPTLLYRLMEEAPAPLTSQLAPAWLSNLLLWCLAKSPADRPQSAAELRAALSDGLAGDRQAQPATVLAPQAGPVALGAAVGAAAGVAAGAGWATLVGNSPAQPAVGHGPSQVANHQRGVSGGGAGAAIQHADHDASAHASSGVLRDGAHRAHRPRRPRSRPVAAAALALVVAGAVTALALSPASSMLDRGQASGQIGDSGSSSTTTVTPAAAATADPDDATTTTVDSSTSTVSDDADSSTTSSSSSTSSSSTSSSSTPPPVKTATIPALAGFHVDEALAQLHDLDLDDVTVTRQHSPTVPVDEVISVDPAAGSKVELDTPIELLVSDGPQLTAVPAVIGLSRDLAVATLEESGFTVQVTSKVLPEGSPEIGTVIAQDPAGNSEAPVASTVTITVGRQPLVITGELAEPTVGAFPGGR